MGQVNSRGESWLSERHPRPAPASGGAQPTAENSGIPGPFRADHRAERRSLKGVLAEGEELSSNPLRRVFNDLQTTQNAVDVVWRILGRYRTWKLGNTHVHHHREADHLGRAVEIAERIAHHQRLRVVPPRLKPTCFDRAPAPPLLLGENPGVQHRSASASRSLPRLLDQHLTACIDEPDNCWTLAAPGAHPVVKQGLDVCFLPY